MKMRAFLSLAAPAAMAFLFLARSASADELNPGSGSAGQITAINSGVTELSLEQIFVLGYDQRDETKNFRMSLFVGPTFRYFVAKNTVLGFNVSFFYKDTEGQVSASDLGGMLNVTLGYTLPLAGGMFLKPLVGGGGFYGQRKEQVPVGGAPTNVSASIYGGVARFGVDMIFYSNARTNLFAGPEAVMSFGGTSTEKVGNTTVDGKFFLSIDGGFNVGISYVF